MAIPQLHCGFSRGLFGRLGFFWSTRNTGISWFSQGYSPAPLNGLWYGVVGLLTWRVRKGLSQFVRCQMQSRDDER
jgi:hypothetical protein